jgi:antitoxin component YwqK of YwqJK toxin-antitoxin module
MNILDNAQKFIECHYRNGKLNGLYQSWFENGQKWVECHYLYDNYHGLYIRWWIIGEKEIECQCGSPMARYLYGKVNGLYQVLSHVKNIVTKIVNKFK